MRKNGISKFVLGTMFGVGLGLLFAPKTGEETREDLKRKIDEMFSNLKNVDLNEVRSQFEEKLDSIKKDLEDLDKEKVLKIAKDKAIYIKNKTIELTDLAIEKGTPVLQDLANQVRSKTVKALKEITNRLEREGKEDNID